MSNTLDSQLEKVNQGLENPKLALRNMYKYLDEIIEIFDLLYPEIVKDDGFLAQYKK